MLNATKDMATERGLYYWYYPQRVLPQINYTAVWNCPGLYILMQKAVTLGT